MLRVIFSVLAMLALAACTAISARVGDDIPQDKLQAENKSIVLLHTSFHDSGCASAIQMLLAQRDSLDRWVKGDLVTLRGLLELGRQPSQIILPAGDYGVVQVRCTGPKRTYGTRVAQRGSIIDGAGTIYEKPIATFRVGAGEVVDIGSLQLPSRVVLTDDRRRAREEFISVVTTIPDEFLKNLAESYPRLYQARISRPMIAMIRIEPTR